MKLVDRASRAEEVARQAGEILVNYFRTQDLSTQAKGERDVVTRADYESEQLIRAQLQKWFPDDGLVAEEGSRTATRNDLRWFVDPLDGTLNYSRGLGIWCVSIALFEGSNPVLGVIHDPLRDETFAALRGEGARLNGQVIATSGVVDPANAVIHMTIDFDERAQRSGLDDIVRLAPTALRTRNIGSAALSLAYTASGWFDAMLHRSANPWDYGAGVVLVREAGGSCTAIDGTPYADTVKTMAASATADLHRRLVALVSDAGNSRLE